MSIVKLASAGLTEMISILERVRKQGTVSLTQMTKPANIISRVYMEDSVAFDDISLPLLGTLNQLYASYIMTALNMQNVIKGGKTVRELYGVIATETLQDTVTVISEDFGNEVLDSTIQSMAVSMESQVLNQEAESQRLITGRLLELDIVVNEGDSRDGKLNTIKMLIYVQLIPTILPKEISKGFLSINFTPPASVRWKQMQAGEISFWKDFVFSRDILDKHSKLLKDDKSGVLSNLVWNQQNKIFQWMLRIGGFKPSSSNLANTIVILDKPSFTEACKEVGADFDSKVYRQGFFMKTMTMILVIVDVRGGVVDMYFNGIDVKGTYTFDMLNKVGTKGKDNFNLSEVMQAFSQGMSPRF